MAVKTVFSKQQLLEILSLYTLGAYRDSRPISQGTVQTNYFLQSTQGSFVFRYYENRSRGSVLFETNLMHYLKRKNYPCPAPLRNRQGSFVGMYREKPYVIFEYIEGEQVESLNADQQRQVIRKAAELQSITRTYRSRFTAYRWNYSPQLCLALGQEAAKKINTLEATEKLEWLEKELSILHLPTTLPKGICHCDFHPSNILFNNGDLTALLDFDDANYTYLIYDLATLIDPFLPSFTWQTWSHFAKEACVFDFREAIETILEYDRYRPLSRNEKWFLFDVYKLSILFDSIWYYARGNSKDFYEKRKIDRLNDLGRERFYRELFADG